MTPQERRLKLGFLGSAIERREELGLRENPKKKKKNGSVMTNEAWVEGEPKERKMMEITCGKERRHVWRLKYNIWV